MLTKFVVNPRKTFSMLLNFVCIRNSKVDFICLLFLTCSLRRAVSVPNYISKLYTVLLRQQLRQHPPYTPLFKGLFKITCCSNSGDVLIFNTFSGNNNPVQLKELVVHVHGVTIRELNVLRILAAVVSAVQRK